MYRLVAIGLTFFNQFLFYRTTISTAAPLLAHWLILPPSPSCTAMPQFASHNHMDDIPRTSLELPPADAGKWIGRVVIAVIVAEGIWGLIVSLTNNLILPLLARVMGADAQSPLYLGKGDINVPALFTSVLELCFAAIVAVILNAWVQRKPTPSRSKSIRISSIPAQPAAPPPSPVPVQATASVPLPAQETAPGQPAPSPGQFWSPPDPSRPKAEAPPPPPAKPSKPKAPKEVYYNIVGEPINPTEED